MPELPWVATASPSRKPDGLVEVEPGEEKIHGAAALGAMRAETKPPDTRGIAEDACEAGLAAGARACAFAGARAGVATSVCARAGTRTRASTCTGAARTAGTTGAARTTGTTGTTGAAAAANVRGGVGDARAGQREGASAKEESQCQDRKSSHRNLLFL